MAIEYRPFGGTGIKVSRYCLGAMMFGAMGNRDEAECRQHRQKDGGRAAIEAVPLCYFRRCRGRRSERREYTELVGYRHGGEPVHREPDVPDRPILGSGKLVTHEVLG